MLREPFRVARAARFVPVLSMKRTYPMDTIRKMHGLTMKIAVFMDRYAKQPTFYVEPRSACFAGGVNIYKKSTAILLCFLVAGRRIELRTS